MKKIFESPAYPNTRLIAYDGPYKNHHLFGKPQNDGFPLEIETEVVSDNPDWDGSTWHIVVGEVPLIEIPQTHA